MSQLENYLNSKKIKPQTIVNRSAKLEAASEDDLKALDARAEHRAKQQNSNYGEANLGKPKTSGRGISLKQVNAFVAGGFGTKRSRGKIVRALASLAGDGADVAELRKLVTPVPQKKAEKTEE